MRISFLRPANPVPPPRIIRDEIEVPPPKEIEQGEPASRIRTVGLPILLIVLIVGMVALMIRSGRAFSPLMILFPLMMLGGVGGMAFGQRGGTGTSRAQVLEDRKAATRGLGMIREKVFDRGLSMHAGLQSSYPDPRMLASRIGGERMWEVVPTGDGFTALRYGLGDVELAARIVAPEAPPGEFLEPVSWVSTVRFLRHHSTVSSMPVVVTAARFPVIGFTGDRDTTLGMVRSMLLQAAVTHGPDNLAMVVLTDNPDAPEWSWMKWLPHTQHPYELDRLGSARMMYRDWSTLQASLGGDDADPDDPNKVIDFTMNFNPDPEFSTDNYRHVLVVVDSAVTDKLVDSVIAPRAGVTWLLIGPPENALNAEEGITLRCDPDGSVWRSEADRPLAEPVKVAVADNVSLIDARTVGRQLARYEVATLANMGRQAKQAERGRDWQTLMRVRDPGTLDPLDLWSVINRYDDRRRLKIPIGFLQNGDRLELDIKQAAEGGTGPHGQLLGTTGSGKSEFLRNLVINGCVTHSPDVLNWLLVDFKGGATFNGLDELPHVSAVITNMEQEAHLVARMKEMINGEIDRRYRIFREAKELNARYDVKDLRDYEKLRERGVDLPPLPSLFIVIDEWAELLQMHPDYGELFRRIGRVGRSVALHLLYASQNLDNSGRASGLETNIGYKIGLKTQTASDSRALLDGSDAAYRLSGSPGHGVLRPTGGDLISFYAGWTGAAYFPPVVPTAGSNGRRGFGSTTDPNLVEPRAFTAAPQPLPDAGIAEPEFVEPEHTDEEIESAPTVFTTMIGRLNSASFPPPYRMWLPPLEATTLDIIEPRLRDWQVPTNETIANLVVPFGMFDNPLRHEQPEWLLDAEKNLLILGGSGAGKSTAVKSLVCSLALANTPEQIQMYIVDYAGGGLSPLADLPHVGAVVTRADPDAINRILMQMGTLLTARERLFRENRITIDEYRQARTDPDCPFLEQDPYGDVFVIIDGWDAAVAQDQVLQFRGGEVEALIVGARNYGLHFVLTTARVVEMRGIEPNLNTVVELHNETELSRVGSQLAKQRRKAPGHAITTDSQLQGLVSLPRVDSIAEPATVPSGMTALVQMVAERFEARGAERLKTLPTSLTRDQLAAMVGAADEAAAADPRQVQLADKRRLRIALGVREDTLGPAYAEMYREPHLLILGEAKSGKSELIGTVCDSIGRRFATKDDAVIVLIDPRRRHLGRVDMKNVFGHVHREEDIQGVNEALYHELNLASRSVPPDLDAETRAARAWWSGPEIFFVVDDYHLIVDPRAIEKPVLHAMAPWLQNEPLARGFHFVIARGSEELYLASNRDPLIKRMLQDRAPTVLLSADKFDGQIGETKFERFPFPGRARYLEASLGRKNRIQAAWSGVRESRDTDFED